MLPGTFTLSLNGSTFACTTTQNVVNCTSADMPGAALIVAPRWRSSAYMTWPAGSGLASIS
jgi:hypothetical protein